MTTSTRRRTHGPPGTSAPTRDRAKLYVIPLSHPAISARLMLEHKGTSYRTVRLLSGFHPFLLRLAGFRGVTVPALRLGPTRVQGSVRISRFLEQNLPGPSLYPAEPESRKRVELAEQWGESSLQDVPRRLLRWAMVRTPELRRSLAKINGVPLPGLAGFLLKPLAARFARISHADDSTIREDLKNLPALLDRADDLVKEGVIGVSAPNAATFQIAPSLRLLQNFEQLGARFEARPAMRFAESLLPEYRCPVPSVLPDIDRSR